MQNWSLPLRKQEQTYEYIDRFTRKPVLKGHNRFHIITCCSLYSPSLATGYYHRYAFLFIFVGRYTLGHYVGVMAPGKLAIWCTANPSFMCALSGELLVRCFWPTPGPLKSRIAFTDLDFTWIPCTKVNVRRWNVAGWSSCSVTPHKSQGALSAIDMYWPKWVQIKRLSSQTGTASFLAPAEFCGTMSWTQRHEMYSKLFSLF